MKAAASPRLSNLSGTPTSVCSAKQQATTGTTTAQATVVDSSGNVYVLGNATGNFGNQLNQGTQDVYLTKYDSAGNVIWSASWWAARAAPRGYGLALDPAGGVVVTGSTTADVTTTSVANGNTDSFVASYDANGNQNWIQADPDLGHQPGQCRQRGCQRQYLYRRQRFGRRDRRRPDLARAAATPISPNIDSKGKSAGRKPVRHQSGADQVSATATGSDGSLYVASVQNGDAVVSKYASGDITSAPDLDAGSGRAAGRRRHRRPDGVRQPGLCLRHHQQRQSHRRRHGQRRRRRPAAAPTPLSSTSPTMAPAPPPIMSPMSAPRPATRAAR